ncbi:MAG: hypothetical protein NTV26_01240 [Caldiserica bacterium]|nr:hypothetical protein [Caldisericota bacterium]
MATLHAMGPIMIGPSSSHTAGIAKMWYLVQHGFLRPVLEVAGS